MHCDLELIPLREGCCSHTAGFRCPLVTTQSLTSFSSGTVGATSAARQMCKLEQRCGLDVGLLLFYSVCHLVTPYLLLFHFISFFILFYGKLVITGFFFFLCESSHVFWFNILSHLFYFLMPVSSISTFDRRTLP